VTKKLFITCNQTHTKTNTYQKTQITQLRMKFTKLQFCFLLASWLSIAVRADLVAPGSYVKPIQGTVDSVPSGHGQAPSLRGRKSPNGSNAGKNGAASSKFVTMVGMIRL